MWRKDRREPATATPDDGEADTEEAMLKVWQRIDWRFVSRQTGTVFFSAICLITLMYMATAASVGPQVGALTILIWALIKALPLAVGVGLVAAAGFAVWSLRKTD
jgi:hypothetical protein